MSSDRWDSLLDRDWSDVWETLPEAPELVPRSKRSQITLRLPASLLLRIKRIASLKALPYHAMVRSWIAEGVRTTTAPQPSVEVDEPLSEQLNIKLDHELLDAIKARADELRRPYHRLAREWVEMALAREEESLGLNSAASGQPAIKDLMVLLLHAQNKKGEDAIRGITRLQKLMFVIEQKLTSKTNFYAYSYGPFNEEINDAAQALELAGFLRSGRSAKAGPPSFKEMMATAVERSGPREGDDVQEFQLNEQGHEVAERLRKSNSAYERLYAYVRGLREEWDTSDLLERVYEEFPKYAQRSVIKNKVERRARRKRPPHS